MLTTIVNQTLGVLTILAQIFSVLLFILFFTKKSLPNFLKRNFLLIAFIVALGAMAGSLTYSEIIGYEPCKLCWFQRIFMYPQVILLGVALFKKDYKIISYSIALSIIGAIIAGYHYLLQLGVAPSLPCSAIGYSVSCSQRFVMQYGYITIPMMAFSAFILITLLLASYYQNKNIDI